jgi:tetratricopeptide (TPR) repeat protein
MKIYMPLKDVLLGPGKRFDPAVNTEAEVIGFIKKAYGVISSVMDVSISEGVVCIAFKDATPAKVNGALQKLSKAVGKAQEGKLSDALKLFKNVLEVIPEHMDARRNLAKVYLELGNTDQAKRQLDICIQINPKDCWSYIMLGNIYTKHERNLDVAEFYYECGLEHCSEDGMLLNNYANLMMEKGNFSRAEELFKKSLNLKPVHPHSYFGLALLYRVTGHPEESLRVLERLFILMPKTPGIESTQIYTEARNLYSEIKAEAEPKATAH